MGVLAVFSPEKVSFTLQYKALPRYHLVPVLCNLWENRTNSKYSGWFIISFWLL